MAYKVLKAGEKGNGYTSDALYTVPAGKSAVISKVVIYCNSVGGGTTGDAAIWVVSPQTDAGSQIIYKVSLNAFESFEMTGGITLAAGEGLWVFLDTESAFAQMTATIFGDES